MNYTAALFFSAFFSIFFYILYLFYNEVRYWRTFQ
jgi:hypothetical protein